MSALKLSRLECDDNRMVGDSSTEKYGISNLVAENHCSHERQPPCIELSEDRRKEIETLGVELIGREARRSQIEDRLNHLRQQMSLKSSGEEPEKNKDISQTRQEDTGSGREGGDSPRKSISRQRLRQQTVEKVVGEYLTRREQLCNLSLALQEREQLVGQLRSDLKRLEQEMEECRKQVKEDALKQGETALEELDRMEKTIEAKDEQIDYYEFKLHVCNKKVLDLKLDLADARRRGAQLEVQLEVNQFKYSSYEDFRRQLDREALNKIGDDVISETESQDESERYMQKLVADLDVMEKLYLQSKYEAADQIVALEEECLEFQATIASLERRLGANWKQDDSFASLGSTAPNNLNSLDDPLPSAASTAAYGCEGESASIVRPTADFLKKRMEVLEAENIEYYQKTEALKAELRNAREGTKQQNDRDTREMISLRLENEALIHRLAALEIEMGLASGKFDSRTRSRRYQMLEKNFDEYIVEIMSLEDQLRMKDRIISRLKSQTVANWLEPYLERTPERDTESKVSLKSAKWFEIASKTTADETESSSVSELQSQLTDIQDQLHKKDEALNYVRAKYSATVARLKLKVETKERHYAKADMDVYFI